MRRHICCCLFVTAACCGVIEQSWSPCQQPSSTRQYDAGDPTPEEQLVLEMTNRARADPVAEGKRLGIDITEGLTPEQQALVGPRPPLAMNKHLLAAARAHSADMYENAYFAHEDKERRNPGDRIKAAGYEMSGRQYAWGENIAAQTRGSLARMQNELMVDKGTAGRGHRINLLDIHERYTFREIGVGGFRGNAPNAQRFGVYLTEDFGLHGAGPFLLGVVYQDRNENHFYDPGEGMAAVTITPDRGGYSAVTSRSGGYAIPCPRLRGTLRVTASGGDLPQPMTLSVKLSGTNAKLDFVLPR
jgi:uncharacterized protein YkwD